jgi:hypothetical protein
MQHDERRPDYRRSQLRHRKTSREIHHQKFHRVSKHSDLILEHALQSSCVSSSTGKNSIHNGLVDRVKMDLQKQGFEDIYLYVPYTNHKGAGEIDIYAIYDGIVVNVEVKCSNCKAAHRAAVVQLARSQHSYFRSQRVLNYFAYPDAKGKPVYVPIPANQIADAWKKYLKRIQ